MIESAPGELEIVRDFINSFARIDPDRKDSGEVSYAAQWLQERAKFPIDYEKRTRYVKSSS